MDSLVEQQQTIVSFDDEALILVDTNDHEIGYESKLSCHDGDGVLHRAFSLFIFNNKGEILLQQRSESKRLWPLYWSNSCCSHPRQGETMEGATKRRLLQELGLKSDLQFVYKFQYQANFKDIGAENELCWVYLGKSDSVVETNVHEIAAWRFVSKVQLEQELHEKPEQFTPWFKMEWECLKQKHADKLAQFLNNND